MKTLGPVVLITGWIAVQAAAPNLPDAGNEARAAAASAAAVAAGTSELQTDLEEIIGRPGWTGDKWSVMVVSLDRGDTLFSHAGNERLAPASNMKLFTTAAGLYYLGPDFRFNTFLMAAGPIANGVLDGDVVVYGTGDPTFSSRFGNPLAVWQAFADTIAALGIREIRGNVVGDGSYFEGSGAGEGWQPDYMNAAYAASAGALSFAENIATLQIRPGAQAGHRPTVQLVPGGEGVAIVNQATTVAGGSTRVSAARVAYDGPIIVTGQIGRNAGSVLRSVPVSDPARFSAAVFREVLTKKGIVVTGGVQSANDGAQSLVTGRSVFAPAFDSQTPVRVLAVHTSGPLLEVLHIINQRSHNLMAEQVLRTVGRVALGEGSVAGGQKAVQHMLEQEDHVVDVDIYDGSGLSIMNRSSARGIIEVLALMSDSPMWDAYWGTLPEAGVSRGLRRMQRTGAERNLRAKTGTINNVSALSGYVTAANGEKLAFSIISNNVPSTWMAKRVEDAIGARLAEFTRPLDAAPAAAQPPSPQTQPAPAVTAPDTTARTAAPPPAAESKPPAPAAAAAKTHTVRSGDTLDGIAKKYGTTVKALQAANPGLNPRRLQLGKTIKLP